MVGWVGMEENSVFSEGLAYEVRTPVALVGLGGFPAEGIETCLIEPQGGSYRLQIAPDDLLIC